VRQPPPTATVPAKTSPLYIPIGEFLLLAGVWYLYKKEEAVDGDSSKQTHSALGTPQNETNYQDRLERSYWAVWIVILLIGIFIVTAHTVQLFIHGHCSSPPSDTWKLKYDPLNSDTHSTVIIHKDTNTPYAGYLNNKPHYWQPPTNSQEIHNDAKAELVTNITFQVTATTNAVSLEPPWSTNSHF
jgi:cytoskeletal protein RodZ